MSFIVEGNRLGGMPVPGNVRIFIGEHYLCFIFRNQFSRGEFCSQHLTYCACKKVAVVDRHSYSRTAFIFIVAEIYYGICFSVVVKIAKRNSATTALHFWIESELYVNVAVVVYRKVPCIADTIDNC